jgi:D-alanine-D-alanine ligase
VKKTRILALVHDHLVPPEDTTGLDVREAEWKMEYDVIETLRERGHDVAVLGIHDDLTAIRHRIGSFKPQIVFNLLEAFAGVTSFDQNVVSYLELLRMPYTGGNPRGLILARDKALSKKLLAYHRIPVPEFTVVRRRQKPTLSRKLQFPLIVKSLFFEASVGISQASVVENDDQLQVFPVWEMSFAKMPENRWRIATERVKWSTKYQLRHGIMTNVAELPQEIYGRVQHLAKRVYRALDLNGYARIDLRLGGDGRPFVLEANPNPNLAYGEDFAESAEKAGVTYERLLERIIALGLQWEPERTG